MTKTITIELANELEHKLEAQAMHQKKTIEEFVVEWLAVQISPLPLSESDPIMPLVGTLSFSAGDLAKRHDEYLGAAVYEEINRAG
ncbi:MAG: hypothetical protein U9Q82_02690 [Chloroflexota bacterium]|nr:hypothetical protein [Chloroflexota bacterium]